MIFARSVGDFVNKNPSMKILALSFLLLIGVMLCAEGFDQHVDKGYIYFAMGFALAVELVNMRFRKKKKPAHAPLVPVLGPVDPSTGEHGEAPAPDRKETPP